MDISKWSYLLSIIPVVGLVLKTTIDNWELTDLEKKIMNNYKKFQITAVKLGLLGLLYGSIATLLISSNSIEEHLNLEVLFLISVVFSIVLAFIMDRALRSSVAMFTLKYDFFIVDEKGREIHRVIKLSGKDTLLVKTGDVVEFVTDIRKKKYLKKFRENKKLEKLYREKYPAFLIGGLAVGLTILGYFIFNTEMLIQLILYLVFLLFFMILAGVVYGYSDYKRVKDEVVNDKQEEVEK